MFDPEFSCYCDCMFSGCFFCCFFYVVEFGLYKETGLLPLSRQFVICMIVWLLLMSNIFS